MEEKVRSRRVVLNEIPGAVVLYADGSIDRTPSPSVPASVEFINGVATKDVSINPRSGTWVRIFLPQSVAHRTPSSSAAPLVLYFHGGGMCVGSPAEPTFHNFCSRMASASSAIWISVSYRLAPEHRLPAQYQDCFEALCWLRSQFMMVEHPPEMRRVPSSGQMEPWEAERVDLAAGEKEPWVVCHGDASRVFCTGESAGATILHFITVEISKWIWSPLSIQGVMFVDVGVFTDPLPEMSPSTDPTVTTKMMATSIALCLPDGAKLGDAVLDCLHPNFRCLLELPWPPVLLLTAERDLLREGGLKYFKSLRKAQKNVEMYESPGKGHCFHLQEVNSEASKLRERAMVQFVKKLSL